MALGCADQICPPDDIRHSRVGVALGCMAYDSATNESFLIPLQSSLSTLSENDAIKDFFAATCTKTPSPENLEAFSLVRALQSNWKIEGAGILADAACASTLAALEIACEWLESEVYDYVLFGGVESGLGPETFASFSKLGVLSAKDSAPFTQAASGIIPSEGAALFLLSRTKPGTKVLAHIRGTMGNSNAESASLFSPSEQRIGELYSWARDSFPKIDYLECHATSTQVGDLAEASALNQVFASATQPIPIGSAKASTGHLLGAAGAISLVKTILVLSHRLIPKQRQPGEWIRQLQAGPIWIPSEPHSLPNSGVLRSAVFSAGFGGANYCAVIESADSTQDISIPPAERTAVVIVGHGACAKSESLERCRQMGAHLPPLVLERADRIALAAISATAEALERSLLRHGPYGTPEARVSVISAGALTSDKMREIVDHTRFMELQSVAPDICKSDYEKILGLQPQHEGAHEEIAEALSSAIAGRIAMEFHFTGKSVHIEGDRNSSKLAWDVARSALVSQSCNLAVLAIIHEERHLFARETERFGVDVFLLSRASTAERLHWPVLGKVEPEIPL